MALISALFIDFDNVHSMLCDDDPNVGARFANRPLHWLKALESDPELIEGTEGVARRIVSRRCYASPGRITPYRRNFTQTGFEVVDCPPLTTHMKNSADITMVMDVMDYVVRYPTIEEYIVLSTDADFVPLLNRLRKEMKRSAIFTAANTSSAYRNCADRTIDTQFFALHLGSDAERGAPGAAPLSKQAVPKPAVPAVPSLKSPLDTALAGWNEAERELLGDFVADVANAAHRPIPMLSPAVYSVIFDAFAAYYRGQPQSFYDAVASVAAACGAAGYAVAQQDIRFIGTGISIQGYRFGSDADPRMLAGLWRLQLFDLCDAPEWMREDEDPVLLATWCHASNETTEQARDDFLARTAEETGDPAASLAGEREL
jgi:hypothetical protein